MALAGLLIPYLLYPLATLAVLRRIAWRGGEAAMLPLALGLGPLAATFVLETWLWLRPGPPALAAGAVLTAVPLLVLAMNGRVLRGAGLLARDSLAVALAALALLAYLWLQVGDHLMIDWDPACFRLVADRIAAQGTVDPHALILEPTVNELLLIHPFHGLRYPLLLAFNRVLGDSRLAVLDALPAVWFLWASALLVGGAVAGPAGWRGGRAWFGAWFALLSFQALLWTVVGQSASVAGFTLLALFLAALHAALRAREAGPDEAAHWLLAGVALGLAVGVHRTSYAYGIVYVALALAARPLATRARCLAIGAGGVAALLLCLPFEAHYQLEIGSLLVANPVSPGLVPWRATWREAFEVPPLGQAWQQFWVWEFDALHWWAGALGGAWALWRYARRGRPDPARRAVALAAAAAALVLAVVLSDLALILFYAGQELTVRSTRYRTHLQPVLAWVGAWALLRLPLPRWRPPRAALALAFALAGGAAIAALLHAWMPAQLAWSTRQIERRWHDVTTTDEVARLVAREPALRPVLDYLAARPRDAERLLLDYPALFRWIDHPMRNMWLNPGVFPVLGAADPAAALAAARGLDLRWHLFRVSHGGAELYSATGLRHTTAAAAAALVVDTRSLQLFELDDAPHPLSEVTPTLAPRLGATGAARAGRNANSQLFAAPIVTPGDYELSIDFEARTALDLAQTVGGRVWRRFRLRAWRPPTPGPQRVRFRVEPGKPVGFTVTPAAREILRGARVSLWRRD